MSVTAGRPGGGRAREGASRGGLRLVHSASDVPAVRAGGSARGGRSPSRCPDGTAALVGVTAPGVTDPGGTTGRDGVAVVGHGADAAARAGTGPDGAVDPHVAHGACADARTEQDAPRRERLVAGVDLVRELEEQVLELRADGPTVAHRAALADLLVAWAESLVALHRTPVPSTTPVVPLPRVLGPEGLGAQRVGRRDGPPGTVGRAWAVRQHPRVRRALAVARAGWAADRWVHDAGPDVVVVLRGHEPVGQQSGPRAELVAAGRGDARWDVATALDWLAVHLAPTLDPAWELDPVAGFMRAYRASGGDAEPDRPLAVARTVATAAAWSDALDARAHEPDDDELAWVAGLWARPLALLAPR